MRSVFILSMLALISTSIGAQEPPAATAPAAKSSRDALIRSALARDSGEITAMESSVRDGGGIFIGYSSGAVVNCFGKAGCRVLDGTPSSAVTGAVSGLGVSRSGGAEVIWISYPHGVIYRCVDYLCREFDVTDGGDG